MHLDLLVRPVVLGMDAVVIRILEVFKDPLHIALAMVGGDNLGIGPVISAGNQDPLAKEILRGPPVGILVDLPVKVEAAV